VDFDYWIIKFCDTTFLPPTATAFSDSLLCPGTCTNFINLSFNATSYQWSFAGAIPATSTAENPTNICYVNPGTYDVQLIATNANGSDTLLITNYITVYPPPPPQAIIQSGDTLFAIPGASSYEWYFNGNNINGATNYFYVASSGGDYNVVVTDSNGCEVEAVINDVVAAVTPFTFGEGSGVRLYPNPVKDKFTIHNSKVTRGAAAEVTIYNVMGEKIYTTTFSDDVLTVDCRLFPSGIYFLEMNTPEKSIRTKFVKQ
jgi:PKD repeat protein